MTTTARLNRGFRDVFAADLQARWAMIERVRAVYERWGFSPLETPALEYVEVLGKFLPESATPEGGIFAFRNEDDEWVALRYDLTAPLSRVVAQYPELPRPFRRYQVGPVWRLEKPGPGRFREFYQLDFDTVGVESMAADAEVALIICEALAAVGFQPSEYQVRLNNRKVLAGVLEAAGLSAGEEAFDGSADGGRTLTVLRAIDKLDRVGIEGVKALLGAGRKDPSGDFTPGAQLEPKQIEWILAYFNHGQETRGNVCHALSELVKGSKVGEQGVEELRQIDAILSGLEVGQSQIVFDPTIVRGLAYYTGPVVEGVLTFPIVDEQGQTRSFGAVYGGGRYDGLVERFTGQKVPATGASMGVDRLAAALQAAGRRSSTGRTTQVLITTMDPTRLPEYYRMASELRGAGINCEVFPGGGGFRKQLKYADKTGVPLAVIAGEDELGRGVVQVKNLLQGRVLASGIADRQTWLANQPAQQEVGRAGLVALVKRLLAGG